MKYILGVSVLLIGLFTITVHEKQVETIDRLETHIRTLEGQNSSRELIVKEQQETIEKLSNELSEVQEELNEALERNKELTEKLEKLIPIEATAYTPECEGCSGITYTGVDVRNTKTFEGRRVVATDPSVIPMGTELIVHTKNGSIDAIAKDIGGDIKGNRLDLLFLSEERAWSFGRQDVVVEIVSQGNN